MKRISYIKQMQDNNNNVDNIKHLILPTAVYCWKPTLDVNHPFIRHNRVELYYGNNFNSELLDQDRIVDLLKRHLEYLHEELRSDHIIPSYGLHRFHVKGNQDKSLQLSVIFWCEREYHDNPEVPEVRFCDLINAHFEQIRSAIEEGRLNKQENCIVFNVNHPYLRYNTVELHYGSNFNSELLDQDRAVQLLKHHLEILFGELRRDRSNPTYGWHRFHVKGSSDTSLQISFQFWCDKEYNDNREVINVRFYDLIHSHFEQIRSAIERGQLKKQQVIVATTP